MSYVDAETGERCPTGAKLPAHPGGLACQAGRRRLRARRPRGIVTRVGDETVGEMWSLYDGQDVLDEIDPPFSEHIRHHVRHAALADPFHVSANTDPKGDRTKRPQDQDPDVLLHVAGETDNGIIVRGAKFETAAAYANQAFVKPTIGDWGDAELSDYAVGFIADMGAPGVKPHLPLLVRRARTPPRLSAVGPLRRDRHDDRLRRRRDPVGERPLLPPHPRGRVHPGHAAPLQHVPVRPASPALRRPAGRRRRAQRHPDRGQGAPGRAREAGRAGLLPRGHQRASDRRDRAGRAEPGRAADAQPGAALHRARARLHPAAGDDAPRPRPVRRPALRDPERGDLRRTRRRGRGWTSTSPSATSTPSSAAGCSRSRGTCSTPTTPGTG